MFQGVDYVYEVYKAGSFSRAAKNLFVSQPALSTAVQKTEARIGGKIFNRNTTPLTLTKIGEAYIHAVESVMDIEHSLQDRISEINDLKYGHLNVGGANFFSSCMLPKIIKKFSCTYPGITLEITEEDSLGLYDHAMQNHIDLILDAGTYDPERFSAYLLLTEHLLLGIPEDNPINQKLQPFAMTYLDIQDQKHLEDRETLDLSLLSDQKFLLLNKGHDLYNRSVGICESYGFVPHNVLYLNQQMTAYNLAVSGIGLVFITDTLVKLASHQNELVYYKISHEMASRECFLAHRKIIEPTKAMQKFIDISRQVFKD